jgi:serralysin
VAGRTYAFALVGTGTHNVSDPFLSLRNSGGIEITNDDDSGPAGNATIVYTAAATGRYFLDAGSFNGGSSGQYTMSVTQGTRPSFDYTQAGGALDPDASWSPAGTAANVTWGFRSTAASYTVSGSNIASFTRLSTQEQAGVQALLNLWAAGANVTFTQVNPGGFTDSASVLIGNYYDPNDGAGAFAFYPGSTQATAEAGDIWLNTCSVSTTSTLFPGSYSYFAIMHEMGHMLGLSHPGDYNAGPNVAPTYANAAQFVQDTQQYSVMSYFDGSNSGANLGGFPTTPMLYDIYEIQQIYGANTTTRTGNTVYGFHNTAGAPFDFSSGAHAFCIWDAGGNDTLDCSGFSQAQTITLVSGDFSSIGGLVSNISIAYGAVIENAVGGSGNDMIYGTGTANGLYGGAGNDRLVGGAGSDLLYGGTGNDTLLGDGAVVLTEAAASIKRLYLATLNRAPDDTGWQGWVDALTGSKSLSAITKGFINSAEFQAVYGALNNNNFVTLLYNNVLRRVPDTGGLAGWLSALAGGTSRENVVNGFSESAEFQINTNPTPHAGQVYRLYGATLDRAPDAAGFTGWVDALDGPLALAGVAGGFVGSAEFQAKYGPLTDTNFVKQLYLNVLHRAADAAGLQGWLNALGSGTSRTRVVLGFSESAEYTGTTAAAFKSYMQTVRPDWNDIIEGGAGDDILSGGHGADTYVFRATEVGADQVYQFESWDTLQMVGFGYANTAAAMSHMSQSGANVVFADKGETITFHGVSLGDVQAATWIVS